MSLWKGKTSKIKLYNETYWNKPKNINISNLQPTINKKGDINFYYGSSYATVKLNGKRMFLLVLKKTCWLLMPPSNTIAKFGEVLDETYDGTYFDGEFVVSIKNTDLIEYSFYAFDILFYKSEDVRNKFFKERYELMANISDIVKPYFGKVIRKNFYYEGNIYERMNMAAIEYKNMMK
jgi:hypothetical protein